MLKELTQIPRLDPYLKDPWRPSIPELTRELLILLGEDPNRPGLKKTPERFSKAMGELVSGYSQDINAIINGAIYPAETNELVLVKNISFYSLCEHHLLPFHGKVYVGYQPNKKIIGLSKIPRIVQVFSRRLQLQERLASQIAQTIDTTLEPLAVGVLIRGRHMCLEMRGAKASGAEMATTAYRGSMKKSPSQRSEFLRLLGQ